MRFRFQELVQRQLLLFRAQCLRKNGVFWYLLSRSKKIHVVRGTKQPPARRGLLRREERPPRNDMAE
jgi:hypothetical protein